MKKQYYIIYAILNIIILYIFSTAIVKIRESEIVINEIHESPGKYKFISPLLECNINNQFYNPWNIKNTLENYIENTLKYKKISDISYYVRLLNNWSNFWYNEETKFIPASLVKLPLAISLMKQISIDDLQNIVNIKTSPQESFEWEFEEDNIKVWQNYSIYTLLSEMLINSDNTAALWILEYLNYEITTQTYENFWMWIVDFTTDNSLNMSVKSYASFFRVLYNSSYLTRESSEQLLFLLSKSSFKLGIREPIPNEITIANKFWVRLLPGWEKHIHDCWIIYLEKNPYLICVMTRWYSEKEQLQSIRDISKIIYEDISSK